MFERHYSVWPEKVPKFLDLPQTSVYQNLAVSALRYPQRVAIHYYDSPITYAELDRQVTAMAGYLQHLGVQAGDRVLLYMQNSPQFIIGFYAILRANAVVVPVNPMNRTAELEYLIGDTGAVAALCAQELFECIEPHVGRTALKHAVVTAIPSTWASPPGCRCRRPSPRRCNRSPASGCTPGRRRSPPATSPARSPPARTTCA